jgi:hypothetical protein
MTVEQNKYGGLTRIIHEFPITKSNCLLPLEMLEICNTQKWGGNYEH